MSNLNKEIVNEILERIKGDFLKEIRENNVELNIKPLRHAKLLDREEISLTESKVGGYPYIPIGERAPMFYDEFSDCEDDEDEDEDGNETMALFAQINCEDLKGLENFPEKGLIQIYLQGDTNFEVCDEDDLKVIYYENIGEHYSEEELKEIYNPKFNWGDFPFGETLGREIGYALEFSSMYNISEISEEKQKKYLETTLEKMNLKLSEEEKKDIFLKVEDDIFYNFKWNEYIDKNMEIVDEKACGIDSRTHCGGYPDFFEGYDPREKEGEKEKYDTVLFQLGSDLSKDGDWRALIFDAGFVNFFINSEKLKNKDFSDIFVDVQCG